MSFARRHTAMGLDEVTRPFRTLSGKWTCRTSVDHVSALLELELFLNSFALPLKCKWRTAMQPFYSCEKAHRGASNPELFHSLSGIQHDAQQCRHVWVLGRHIVMPPTPSSSARCRKWARRTAMPSCLSCEKAHRNATNPEFFRSLSEFNLCFLRHSEAEWMLRTDLA